MSLSDALYLAQRGWKVIPLHDMAVGYCSCRKGLNCSTPGKHPRLGKWPEQASCDPNLIAGWWEGWPNANVGVVTGVASKLLVLDVDPRSGGFESLAAYLPLPSTPTVSTGGGGRHYYFEHPGGKIQGRVLADGLELKADGQFVVAPPSQTGGEEGRPAHAWIEHKDRNPAPAPDTLLAGGRRPIAVPSGGGPIPAGKRHVTLARMAGAMRRQGMTGNEIAVALLTVFHERCEQDGELTDADVADLAYDVARRYPGHDPAQVALREQALRILNGDAPGEPSPAPPAAPGRPAKRRVIRRAMSEITPLHPEWLIQGWVPLGTLTLIAGVGGLGKSALALSWAADVTNGGEQVLVISSEDSAQHVLRPRFAAAGGNPARFHDLTLPIEEGTLTFPTDFDEVARHVEEVDAKLLIIDPISASLDLSLDSHRDQHVRVVLGKLHRLAEERHIAAVMIAHLNKTDSKEIYLRISGSTGFYNAARSVITVTPDKDVEGVADEFKRLIAQHKHNYGQLQPTERWQVVPTFIGIGGEEFETMKLEYVEKADDVTRDDVLSSVRKIGRTEQAEAFLLMALEDHEWHEKEPLIAQAERQGMSDRTIQRAAKRLNIESEQRGFPARAWWRLPDIPDTVPPEFETGGEPE